MKNLVTRSLFCLAFITAACSTQGDDMPDDTSGPNGKADGWGTQSCADIGGNCLTNFDGSGPPFCEVDFKFTGLNFVTGHGSCPSIRESCCIVVDEPPPPPVPGPTCEDIGGSCLSLPTQTFPPDCATDFPNLGIDLVAGDGRCAGGDASCCVVVTP